MHYRPDVIESFQKLAQTGCVEFLGETYYHSLASLFSRAEFERQVVAHQKAIKELFGQEPKAFRNTELIYFNGLDQVVRRLGFETILTEGVDRLLTDPQGANRPYLAADGQTALLLRNHSLSDDIAFRLSDPEWAEYPLTGKKYAAWLQGLAREGAECVNLYMDYETFGEHRRKETGIFEFLENLPTEVLAHKELEFATPSQIARRAVAEADLGGRPANQLNDDLEGEVFESGPAIYDVPEPISWADASRSLAAWTADNMQKDALKKVYALEPLVTRAADARITEVWGRLQISDHFYYMSTRFWHDPVHRGFSPYRSPYDAYINYMNVLSDFEMLIR